jgi:signal transduction histidine kinase
VPAQELERLAGILAHEIRNPLASAVTNLAVACDLMDPSDPRAPFLQRAEAELDRMSDLLSSCLGLCAAGRIRREVCDIGDLIRDVLARQEDGRREVSIEYRIPEPLRGSVDPRLVSRCLENLIENGIRECGEGNHRICIQARLETRQERDGLLISVEDSGPDVPQDMRETIFDAFVSGGKGTGLGLCFVRLVAEAHGGCVSVARSELGGASFELFIPVPEPAE